MGKAKRNRAARRVADRSLPPADARSFELKLARANQHLQEIEREVGGWVQTTLKTVREQSDPDDSRYRRVLIDAPVPDHAYLSLLTGDCLQCLRSMLDHLAFELAAAFTVPMTDAIEKNCAFPILGDKDRNGISGCGATKWASSRATVSGMDPAAQAIIEGLQPYHRRQSFDDDPLWRLNALNNIDKHRTLHVVGATMSGAISPPPNLWRNVAYLGIEGEASVIDIAGGIVAEGRTQVARFACAPIDPAKEMHVGFTPVLDIAFAFTTQLVGSASVIGTLKNFHDHIVSDVVPPLVGFLK